jgi:hypothetical protein
VNQSFSKQHAMKCPLSNILVALACVVPLDISRADEVDFENHVRPLLIARCGDCHGPEEQKGGLRLDARHFAFKGGDSGEAIVPRQSEESELVRRITSDDADERMPPESHRFPRMKSSS